MTLNDEVKKKSEMIVQFDFETELFSSGEGYDWGRLGNGYVVDVSILYSLLRAEISTLIKG